MATNLDILIADVDPLFLALLELPTDRSGDSARDEICNQIEAKLNAAGWTWAAFDDVLAARIGVAYAGWRL